jgi:Tfp pilus assembly protein PilF
MADTYGPGAIARMIQAYASNLDTDAALQRSFKVTAAAFEKGYRGYVDRRVRSMHPVEPEAPAQNLAQLEHAAEKRPRDAAILGRLARAYLENRQAAKAEETARKALEIDPTSQPAAYVVAQGQLRRNEQAAALATLRAAFDPQAPDLDALLLLTNLTLEEMDWAEGERLARLGEARFPHGADWHAGREAVYRARGARDTLAALLARRAEGESDHIEARLELADLAVERNDFEASGRWALDAIHIDVTSARAHALLARAQAERGRHAAAIEEYETALGLDPERNEWRMPLAKTYLTGGDKNAAARVLAELLRRDGDDVAARELLESLGK